MVENNSSQSLLEQSGSPNQVADEGAAAASSVAPSSATPLSPAEVRARRLFTIGIVVVALFLVGVIAALIFLSAGAYQAAISGVGPTPGEVVVSIIRDAAIIFVAFESLIIGVLLIILMLQMQSLIVLLRDEIRPMLEAIDDTVATVRGTTRFVSHNVVSPVMKWSGYLAGLRQIIRELGGLKPGTSHQDGEE